jgi:hypothetical protein
MTVVDPAGEYQARNYCSVYFTDPDGMKLEGVIWARRLRSLASRRARQNVKARASRWWI